MKKSDEGIIAIDHEANPCPICGAPPRIHVHKFTMVEVDNNGEESKVKVRKSYYDCSGCGKSITDWCEDEFQMVNRQPRYVSYAARVAWDKKKFL